MACEQDSFVFKFKNLWKSGKNASLTIESNAGKVSVALRVDDLCAPHPHHHVQQERRSRNGAAQQRRREKRLAARQASAQGAAAGGESESVVEEAMINKKDKVVSEKDDHLNTTDCEAIAAKAQEKVKHFVVEEASENILKDVEIVPVRDEFCPDSEFGSHQSNERKMCSIQLFPESKSNMEAFRATVEKYFKERTDIIEKVILCKVENYNTNVRLISIVKIRKVWLNFFNDPRGKYADLKGVSRVIHDCQDLSNCDPA